MSCGDVPRGGVPANGSDTVFKYFCAGGESTELVSKAELRSRRSCDRDIKLSSPDTLGLGSVKERLCTEEDNERV